MLKKLGKNKRNFARGFLVLHPNTISPWSTATFSTPLNKLAQVLFNLSCS